MKLPGWLLFIPGKFKLHSPHQDDLFDAKIDEIPKNERHSTLVSASIWQLDQSKFAIEIEGKKRSFR
jgi:hypothetical protein